MSGLKQTYNWYEWTLVDVTTVPSKIYPGSKLVKVLKNFLKVYIFCHFTKIKIS